MSVAQLKSELLTRTGRNLLPSSLPIETLISLTREMALLNDGTLGYDDVGELTELLVAYFKKLLNTQCGEERANQFTKNPNELLPLLAHELQTIVRDELVSRLIGYTINHVCLSDLFNEHFVN